MDLATTAAAAIAERQAKDDPVWCSHQTGPTDIFEDEEQDALRHIPRYLVLKAEPKFDEIKRAFQHLARWIIEHKDDNEATLLRWFSNELGAQRDAGVSGAALSVDHNCELHAQVALHCIAGVPSALAACAEYSLLVNRTYWRHFKRIRVARVSAVPASVSEVTKWMKETEDNQSLATNIPTCRGIGLPVRSSGF